MAFSRTTHCRKSSKKNQVSKLPDKAGYFLYLLDVYLINLLNQLKTNETDNPIYNIHFLPGNSFPS